MQQDEQEQEQQQLYSLQKLDAHLISDALLFEMAELVSNHYGVWSESAPDVSLRGQRVRWTPAKLHRDYLSKRRDGADSCSRNDEDDNYYSQVVVALAFEVNDNNNNNNNTNDNSTARTLIGHAIGQEFEYLNKKGIWITQLIVHSDHRNRHVATDMLALILTDASMTISYTGIASPNHISGNALFNAAAAAVAAAAHDQIPGSCPEILDNPHQITHAAAKHITYLKGKRVKMEYQEYMGCARFIEYAVIRTEFYVKHDFRHFTDSYSPFMTLLAEGDEYLLVLKFAKQ
jgi:hypothetical protein